MLLRYSLLKIDFFLLEENWLGELDESLYDFRIELLWIDLLFIPYIKGIPFLFVEGDSCCLSSMLISFFEDNTLASFLSLLSISVMN